LDDIGAAMGIKQIGTGELMRKSLAVVALANHAIHGSRRCVCD
jgi:hypothetical protein